MIMITIEQLTAHKNWLINHENGQRLILHNADLRGADLSGAILSNADLQNADLRGVDLRGVDLRSAVLRGAVLRGAVLSSADLSSADLRSADVRNADLRGAVLSNADLRGAVLRGVDLRGAVLSDAVGLSIAADAPERLQAVARAALEPNALDMRAWHTCKTTHCMAGWAVHLAGEPGRILELTLGTEIAGLCLLGPEAHRYFFKGNDEAREFLEGVLDAIE